MLTATDTLLQIDSLHYAADYIPKRALRYFTAPENQLEATDLFLEEAEDVIAHPGEYLEEETGNRFLFHALMIFGALQEEKAIPLIRKIGLMDHKSIDEMLGDRLFDSVSLAIAEIFSQNRDGLKSLLEDPDIDPCVRATCLQSMVFLYGRGIFSREEIVAYFLDLLKHPEEDLPFFYEVIAASSIALYPEELIGLLRKFYREGRIDASHIKLEEIEDSLSLPKEQVIQKFRATLDVRLEDPVAHLEMLEDFQRGTVYERNELCPCGSGLKFKKCCS